MAQAARLTRSAQPLAATAAIRAALLARCETSRSGAAPGKHSTATQSDAIDVVARVVHDSSAQEDGPRAASELDPSPAAPTERGLHEQWLGGSFGHAGRSIDYRLFVPPSSLRSSAPALVVMLHGCTQDAEDFARGTQMNALAREAGVLVLYPEQARSANPQGCWNWFKTQHQQRGRGEPALLAELVRSVALEQGVDAQRIYVAGLSAGGAMAHILGTVYPDVFAAVAVHSGLPHGAATDLPSALSAMRSGTRHLPAAPSPLPTIVLHGEADATVHPGNGQAVVDAHLRSAEETRRTDRVEGTFRTGRRFSCTRHANADGLIMAEHWQLPGCGHAWSGGSAAGSYTDPQGVSASSEILRFFLTHRNSQPTELAAAG